MKEADTKGFKPYSLGVNLKGNIPTRVEKIVSNNVVGMVEGSDPTLKSEAVVFTAHWDHLGVGRAVLGDAIYNGAADNATGCALLLELARAWSAQSPRPKRSAIFLAVTAEEKGLLGSKYYAQNPLVPLGKTALNLNFDMILPLGVPESVVVTGAERTTAWPAVKAAAEKNHLEIEADQRAHLGIFYRSDHFSMAQAGVPAFSVAAGMKIKGKPKDFASKAMQGVQRQGVPLAAGRDEARLGLLGLRRAGPVRPRCGPRRRQRRPLADLEPRGRIPPGAREAAGEVDQSLSSAPGEKTRRLPNSDVCRCRSRQGGERPHARWHQSFLIQRRVASSDSPVSRRLFRLARMCGQPFETASIIFDPGVSISLGNAPRGVPKRRNATGSVPYRPDTLTEGLYEEDSERKRPMCQAFVTHRPAGKRRGRDLNPRWGLTPTPL